jgi:hypothetical protein
VRWRFERLARSFTPAPRPEPGPGLL